MSRSKPKSDFFRVCVSGLVAAVVSVTVVVLLDLVADVDYTDLSQLVVTGYVVAWPLYTVLYVSWGSRV